MTDHAAGDRNHRNDVPQLPEGNDPRDSVEAYDADEGVVLYDAENPLAWLKGTHAVCLGDAL
ncbi:MULTISPECIES: hypothetical protein [Halobacterium]|uniref:Uncharacterized protein n=4 Tax=Halobacterium salinarum TaxID=2242 RepID=Q9HRW0_HALSA|nr:MULTISPECIES: hypothetical protein [Halobacterium]AAG19048.1 hypothetical protein VNG_0520H [Halobacterium salinarum NRC-1]MCF2165612.1 hypothetical protein [Halobacterium salinarum]MCF2168888.1 hypothetical protein [Halobacterium salinarum]MCF2207806.1 hypothetical protein [Halobacterium salinarum]MCF2238908.1 hypothetical protein [Halobacterium salinarum]